MPRNRSEKTPSAAEGPPRPWWAGAAYHPHIEDDDAVPVGPLCTPEFIRAASICFAQALVSAQEAAS